MKVDKFIDAIGSINDKYIAEADKKIKYKKPIWIKYAVSAAACFCIVAVGITVIVQSNKPSETGTSLETVVSTQQTLEEEGDSLKSEISLIARWEDMDVAEQYSAFVYDNKNFYTCANEIKETDVGDYLYNAILTGHDVYEDKDYQRNEKVYSIKKISSACAVAVKLDGKYYIYRNCDYSPETLGQFINDLNLKENLVVGTVIEEYKKTDGYYSSNAYVGLTEDDVFNLLLSDAALKNVGNDMRVYEHRMCIDVSVEVIGYNNVGISVSEDGYVVTNICDTEKAFFIGKDKVNKFFEYIKTNCAKLEETTVDE